MHLKKVDIFGFKSFADKTEILFEKGITCVVGPNGCGKSNISDAVRWVLGERSAKLLRGSRMEDFIFSGTEFRKPLNMAEVSLTIDNSDKVLLIGFDEVVLTRRLYRSGESEYLINKTPCRYKDIQDLILDTGIGANSYSMIEQGRIDYILNAQEDERRFLIEEAAGISRYKVRKEEALRKLERTESNLLRLNDIVSEVEKNIRYAERQAKRAEKYKEKLEELKRLEIQKAVLELEGMEQDKKFLMNEHQELSKYFQQLQSEIDRAEEAFRELEAKASSIENQYSESERKKYDTKLRLSQAEEKVRANLEKKIDLENANQELAKECVLAECRMEALREEFEQKEKELASFRSEVERARERAEQLTLEFAPASGAVSRKETAVNEQQAKLFELARELADLRNRLIRLEIDLQNEQSKKMRAQQLIERLSSEKEGCLRRIEPLGDDPALLTDLKGKKGELDQKIAQQSVFEAQFRFLEENIVQKRTEMKEIQSQTELLEELEREGVFDDATAAQIVEESKREGSVIHGFVKSFSELVQVEEGYEGAIRAALADWAHALVVNDHEQAMRILDYARGTNAKEFAIMIHDGSRQESQAHRLPEIDGVKGRAKDFLRVHPNYEGLVDEHLHNVLIVGSLTKERLDKWASVANGFKIVSRDGYVLGPGLKIQYLGSSVRANGASRKKDLNLLKKKISVFEAELVAMEEKKRTLALQRSIFKQEIATLEQEMLDRNIQYQSSSRLKESLVSQVQHFEEEITISCAEIDQAELEIRRFEEEKSELDTQVSEWKEMESREQAILKSENEGLNALAKKKEEVHRSLIEEEQKLERSVDHGRYLKESMELFGKNEQAEKTLQEKRRIQIEENRKTLAELVNENAIKTHESENLQKEISAIELEAQRISADRLSFSKTRSALFSTLQEKKSQFDKFKERERDIDLQEMEISYKGKAVEERMKQTYHVDLKQLDKTAFQLQNVDVQLLNQEIELLKGKLEGLGTVNLLAIEEYESLKERYDFLTAQKQDLEKSREDLLEAIRKINRTTKKLFEETFAKVQVAFREYFRILFGGGEAELVMIDEANPLESGIDIMVRPPGKKNQQITLLSGGEKALTATALLFALFKIKPSPFCVLDEVDAPLDESNVHRFLEVVKGFLGATQFIIVTHNRKTIASGDSLYGVTMEEAGISKIVSVKLTQDPSNGESKAESVKQLNEMLT